MVKNRKFRKSKEYKELKPILENLFGKTQFIDTISIGISFKWYFGYVSNILTKVSLHKFLEDNIPKHLFDRINIKYLDIRGKNLKLEPDWLEHVFGSRHPQYPYSIRLIINMKEICNHERNDR